MSADSPEVEQARRTPEASGPTEVTAAARRPAEVENAHSPEVVRGAAQEALRATESEVIRAARYIQTRTRSEVHVQLHPPELGRMKVSVEMREGQVEVRIQVENPEVRDAIRNELANLDRALREAQVDVSRFEVGDYYQGPGGDRQEAALPDPYGARREGGAHLRQPAAAAEVGWVHISDSGRMDCLV